jgi:hypothetical protein
MIKKIIMLTFAIALVATPAFAGNIPEFDAVGCDATNYFALQDMTKQRVVDNVMNGFGELINCFSDFTPTDLYSPYEFFTTDAGQLQPDPCFPGYLSALTDPWNQGLYRWQIVLQMKPESDINLNIVDCVLKHNTFDIWWSAEQTGRFRRDNGQLVMVLSANPRVTAKVYPGPFHTNGFPADGFYMDARQLPGLDSVPMDDALYTSKAFWEEGIVMVLPETGTTNSKGEAVYNLKQGDAINVCVAIPGNNTVDLFYGRDSVILKYIGIIGTEYVTGVAGANEDPGCCLETRAIMGDDEEDPACPDC